MTTLQDKRLFLLDMDGTIYLDEQLFDGTKDFLNYVRMIGGRSIFLTNNSSRSVDAYLQKMARLGIDAVREDFLTSVDALTVYLHRHGYDREGLHYRAVNANSDTIALFCHFGVECVLLSHLLNISPMPLWHGFCAAPTSVTSIYTEERRKGIASFRVNEFGSTEHLYVAGETPSFSARFCECYDNEAQRHD